jgi:multidrug resistance protein, MATE family
MLAGLRDLKEEFRPMFALAVPVVVAELGWITMGMVDTLMVGRLSPEAIGAVGVGSSIFLAIGIFAMGLLLGLDTLVAQAFGAGRPGECHVWLVHGVAAALALTGPVMGALWVLSGAVERWGLHPAVLELTQPYLSIVTWSVLPLLFYAAFRRYLQGMGVVRPVMIALVLANVMNVCANWVLIFGHLGAPALGVRGAAWATVASRVVMAAVLLGVIVYREQWNRADLPDGAAVTVGGSAPVHRAVAGDTGLFQTPLRIEWSRMRRLVALGFPAAMQVTLEVGVFAAATALAGRLAPAALAAHQIALHFAGFTFMIPLGVASAGAVRVGHAMGRRDARGVRRSGWTALLFGAGFMLCAAVVFITFPRLLIGAFTRDEAVLAIGASLLLVAAVFQLFDGLQGVATGVLRGFGDTRSPMLWNLAGHWFIGLPLGYVLAFVVGYGVIGLWWGLSTGLIICGVALVIVWARHVRHL